MSGRITDEQSAPETERPDLPAVWDLVIRDLRDTAILSESLPDGEPSYVYAQVMAMALVAGRLAGSKDIVADMQERDALGRQRYGTPLQPHNGRKALVDAYQELLDAVVYLRQHLYERDGR